jgi:hypothetical protein
MSRLGFIVDKKFIDCSKVVVAKLKAVANQDTPEHELWFGVLECAILDLFGSDPVFRDAADEWIFSNQIDYVAEVIEIPPESIRNIILEITESSMLRMYDFANLS